MKLSNIEVAKFAKQRSKDCAKSGCLFISVAWLLIPDRNKFSREVPQIIASYWDSYCQELSRNKKGIPILYNLQVFDRLRNAVVKQFGSYSSGYILRKGRNGEHFIAVARNNIILDTGLKTASFYGNINLYNTIVNSEGQNLPITQVRVEPYTMY